MYTSLNVQRVVVSLVLGKSRNLEAGAGAGTVKLGMRVLEMLFSQSGKTRKRRWKLEILFSPIG